jgi:hypothetical protein
MPNPHSRAGATVTTELLKLRTVEQLRRVREALAVKQRAELTAPG